MKRKIEKMNSQINHSPSKKKLKHGKKKHFKLLKRSYQKEKKQAQVMMIMEIKMLIIIIILYSSKIKTKSGERKRKRKTNQKSHLI